MEIFINNNPPPAHSKKHAIPNLLALDPLAPFEFSFPSHDQEFWWDDSSDFSNCGDDLDIAAPYNILTSPVVTAIQSSNNIPPSPDFQSRILSAISKNAPKNVYKKKKSAMKRRRNRRKRKLIAAKTADIDPDFRSIFNNVGDLFVPKVTPCIELPPSIPTVNLTAINKNMLKRFDVVNLPIHSCHPDPSFYEENVLVNADKWSGNKILTSNFLKLDPDGYRHPFGTLPGIHTQLGPVALPNEPFYGHVWHENRWIVHAARRGDPGGGQDGGGRDLRDQRRPGRHGGDREAAQRGGGRG